MKRKPASRTYPLHKARWFGLLKPKQRKKERKRAARFNEKLLVTSASVLSAFKNCFVEYITILEEKRKAEKLMRWSEKPLALSPNHRCVFR